MRAFWLCIVALGLAVSPAMAGTGAGGDKDSAGNGAANTSAKAEPAPAASPSSLEIENELQQMRDLLQAQSKQLQQQDEQIKEQKEQMQTLQDQLTAAHPNGDGTTSWVAAPVSAPVNAPIAPSTGVVSNGNSGPSLDQESGMTPTSINIKGISLTPGGFFAAETVWRQKALASDVNSAFSATPFNGSPAAHMSEFQASGRQSRISMLVEGKLANVKIGGYYETDFLSAGTTSTDTQSNSYTLRQRQFWAQAAFNNGITFTGGQQWSLLTETTHGMDNRTEALPMTIDAQYNVGFSWARQYGARITKNFGNKLWLGFAVEEAVGNVKVHGNPTVACAPTISPTTVTTTPITTTTPATCPSGSSVSSFNFGGPTGTLVFVPTAAGGIAEATINNSTYNNFLLGAFGTSGGLYNPLGNYTYNPSPDLVVKAVLEPGGAWGHYEIFGVFSDFRDRIYPCVPQNGGIAIPAGCTGPFIGAGTNAFNDSRAGGGAGVNARWNLFAKKVDVGFHFLGGDGIARYGSSGALSDVTVRPNGTLAPIHNFQSLGTLQFHPTPKLDIYMNVGGEYEARTQYQKAGPGGSYNEGYGAVTLANYGCWTETLPIAQPATNSNLVVPTGIAGSTGFIPGTLNNCTGDPRNIIEGTLGFWYRFYKGSRGTFQYGMQYSNYIINTWRGNPTGSVNGVTVTTSGQPHADNNMVFTSFRYYLP